MELTKQVESLELAQKLKELGVKQESYVNWVKHPVTASWVLWTATDILNDYEGKVIGRGDVQRCSAFTVAELGEMLRDEEFEPPTYDKDERCWEWNEYYDYPVKKRVHKIEEDPDEFIKEADARAKMLIYKLEKKLLANK